MPRRMNSRKVTVSPCRSAFWITITLLAAPRIVKLPASVLPATSAIVSDTDIPACCSRGLNSATNGTLEMNWLIIRLVENRRNTDDAAAAGTAAWKNPL